MNKRGTTNSKGGSMGTKIKQLHYDKYTEHIINYKNEHIGCCEPASADLLCAAPELLEACKLTMEDNFGTEEHMIFIEEAIAKAEGGA